ncbi:hypothetical protein [Heyndrickxia acidicola]|uniref:Type 4 fimbrial biogenesis protein PilX N-terminal domain-containing protein n=1 Tax=Heyndrickxia acidicola TaxID=209389 RepID=A0ABU6MP36_9BACI|nr:hypothetical protein [Heyndrickxia acidicola]MED1204810.1 hypothetical protein [Heyndrickxia acidicola]
MRLNSKGNALITVLLVTIVLMTIGLSIVTASIQSAKRTMVRDTDVNITYDGVTLLDQITADFSLALSGTNAPLAVSNVTPSTFSNQIANTLTAIINQDNQDKNTCLQVEDLSGNSPFELYNNHSPTCMDEKSAATETFGLPVDSTLTRVLGFTAVTKTAEGSGKGVISRTIRKRIILSPLPSFLKYAAGTNGNLVLNGSPNIVGNVYAENLKINEKANYQVGNNLLQADSPFPSIHGDLYSNSAGAAGILPILQPKNFYLGNVPVLKNDSQFTSIDFPEAIQSEGQAILSDSALGIARSQNLTNDISNSLENNYHFSTIQAIPDILCQKNINNICANTITSSSTIGNVSLPDSGYKLIDQNSTSPLLVPGNLVISNTNTAMTLDNLIVKGDLYVIGNQDISLKNIAVSGDIHLINSGGSISVNGQVYAKGNIDIEASQAVHFYTNPVAGAQPYSITAGGNIDISNQGSLSIDGDIIAGGAVSVNSSHDSVISGKIYSNGNLSIISTNSSLSLLNDVVTNGQLSFKGDSNDPTGENDAIIFNSVIYAQGDSTISNLNILGADGNNDELILLTGGKLMITRMNEFSNYTDSNEKTNDNGIPPADSNIKPLKAFFYTEQNAELYGVGSLFYIDGGIFAKGIATADQSLLDLQINAVRGDVHAINDVSGITASGQTNKYSRFIVVYNKDVLLKRIDALPKVTNLTLFPDQLTIQ